MSAFKFNPTKDIDECGQTNLRRANRATTAIIDAYQINGDDDATVENLDQCNASDLISDIFHLCDQQGWDVDNVVDGAKSYWRNER